MNPSDICALLPCVHSTYRSRTVHTARSRVSTTAHYATTPLRPASTWCSTLAQLATSRTKDWGNSSCTSKAWEERRMDWASTGCFTSRSVSLVKVCAQLALTICSCCCCLFFVCIIFGLCSLLHTHASPVCFSFRFFPFLIVWSLIYLSLLLPSRFFSFLPRSLFFLSLSAPTPYPPPSFLWPSYPDHVSQYRPVHSS